MGRNLHLLFSHSFQCKVSNIYTFPSNTHEFQYNFSIFFIKCYYKCEIYRTTKKLSFVMINEGKLNSFKKLSRATVVCHWFLYCAVSSIQGATKQGILCFKILGVFHEAKAEGHICRRSTFLCDLTAATKSSERL